MGNAEVEEHRSAKSKLGELEDLLRRAQSTRAEITSELTRFNKSRKVLNDVHARLSLAKDCGTKQVVLVRNFPRWLKEAIEQFSEITSDMPQVLEAIEKLEQPQKWSQRLDEGVY